MHDHDFLTRGLSKQGRDNEVVWTVKQGAQSKPLDDFVSVVSGSF